MEHRMSIAKYLIIFAVVARYTDRATSEYFSSVSRMDVLLEVEGHLLDLLEDFMTKTEQNLEEEFLENLSHVREEYKEAKSDSSAYLSNPICAFKLIKRFLFEWADISEYVKEYADVNVYLSRIMNASFDPPTEDDLMGAALGLDRLQKTYALNVADLADGKIMGINYGSAMSASDCMELGMMLHKAGKYSHSLPWLLEAREKFKRVSPPSTKSVMKLALRLQKHLEDNMDNGLNEATPHENETELYYQTEEFKTYEKVCRGEIKQEPHEEKPLRCEFFHRNVPYRLLMPFKMEEMNLDPYVILFHDVLSGEEIDLIKEISRPKMVRSKIHNIDGALTPALYRISQSYLLKYNTHPILKRFQDKLCDITGLNKDSHEGLQVANYGIGGHYEPHFDFFSSNLDFLPRQGNRIATAIFYLTDVEQGGATAFPYLKRAVQPQTGNLLFWYNLHRSEEKDYRTLHAACPVLMGSKWVATVWIRARGQEFIRPCDLQPDHEVSLKYKHVK